MTREVHHHMTPFVCLKPDVKNKELWSSHVGSRCLKQAYVIHRSLYTWFQLALSALDHSQR